MSNPHDQLFKAIFSDAVEVAALVRDIFPPEVVGLLDLDAIEAQPSDFIDEALRAHLSDLGFRIPWRQGGHVHLGLLLEHQSSPDPEMPLRVLRYTLRAWEAAQAEPRPPGRLPLVITLVVFHGPRPWSTPRALSELYDAPPEAIEHLRPYLPELKLLLEDLTVTDDAEVPCDDGGKLALLLLRHAHMNDVWNTVDEHRALLQALMRRRGPLPTLQILRYVMNVSERAPSEALKRRLFKDLPGDVKEEALLGSAPAQVMTYADMLREEGKQIGLRLTEEKAHDVAVDALTRLLQTRFGPLPTWALARLNTLDQNTLLELVPHAVSAPSLEALLTPDQPTRS
jgi:predicted transposase YdaD